MYHTEELIRLPDVAWCYQPTDSPTVTALPALQSGQLTFGSFNKLAKINAQAVTLWCRILTVLPQARLMLLSTRGSQAFDRLRDLFTNHGVREDRLELVTGKPREQYLQYFQKVDIALDPFPYNGGVTTCDALWMGVPVITLAGETYVSRQGVSLLSNVGLEDWIADSVDAYVETAVRWATDLCGLQKLRAELRERMRATLCDGQAFTRDLEGAYRTMWQR